MKEEALALIEDLDDPAAKLNRLREYLQALVLRSLHESEAFSSLAFVGGSSLRFLENLPRFSEDLDFSLMRAEAYQPRPWLEKAKRDLEHAGLSCSITYKQRKTVHTAWVRIAGLLRDAGLSAHEAQNLSIKLEIDTVPPEGADLKRSLVTRFVTLAITHYTLESQMAGKVHALLTRQYPKGRDWYDLIWYRSHRPPLNPKLLLLQNALDQTQGRSELDASRWQQLLAEKLEGLDIDLLARDVTPFLERAEDRRLITRENLSLVLEPGV
ncbi:MAG: nucleotidyl transferase AbiEii/AbiGii toxin family protein [Deltaproteobacteria bacterium]|nr:nucleotidyl transferase AbiEii/AbiGii toxin family protein [Deltaproteobacteria bacterium]